jgi:LppP/LprE lipoprotein
VPRRDAIRRPRSGFARWTRRLLGIAATFAFLAVGVAIGRMVVPGGDEQVAAATAPKARTKAQVKREAQRIEARRRTQLKRAVGVLRRAGYEPVKLRDYNAAHTLRVLIGRPVDSTRRALRAFFFVRGDYVERPAIPRALELRPGLQLDRRITLVYTLYEPDDRECCPSGGDTRVHYRWTRSGLKALDPIPSAARRIPAASGR